jgi:predicted metalloprotease with PDZ domain
MRSRFIQLAVVVAACAAVAAFADDAKKCNATKEECSRQIRQMLAGRLYLGAEIENTAPGLAVKTVVADSPAEHADLRAGDRLVAVNNHRMAEATIANFKQIVAEVEKTHRHLWMIVQRRGALKRIDVMMEPYSKAQIERIVAQHLSEAHSIASATPDSQP